MTQLPAILHIVSAFTLRLVLSCLCTASFAQVLNAQSPLKGERQNSQGQRTGNDTASRPRKALPVAPSLPQAVSVSGDGLIVQKTVNFGDGYSDTKLREFLAQLLASYPKARFLIFVAQDTSGVCANARKYVFDRQLKRLLYLHSDICNLLTGPEESYNWRIWYGVEDGYLKERLPWMDDLIQTDKSAPGQDGRNTFPVSYPGYPETTVWPKAGTATASFSRSQ